MNILSALKSEASKPQKQLNGISSAHRSLGLEEQRRSRQAWQETAHVCKREAENSEGTKGAVGEGEGSEEIS